MNHVEALVATHVQNSKGYEVESMINPLIPVDSVAALGMAKFLIKDNLFDFCVSVAPEGHVYGFFFHCLGASILSVHVDYPPRRCVALDDLSLIQDKRVLILEDDVASGTSLTHVIRLLQGYQPAAIDLYLGRPKHCQTLENVDPAVRTVFLAEDCLEPHFRQKYERDFIHFFSGR